MVQCGPRSGDFKGINGPAPSTHAEALPGGEAQLDCLTAASSPRNRCRQPPAHASSTSSAEPETPGEEDACDARGPSQASLEERPQQHSAAPRRRHAAPTSQRARDFWRGTGSPQTEEDNLSKPPIQPGRPTLWRPTQ